MEYLGWDVSSLISNTPKSLWSNIQQNQFQESFMFEQLGPQLDSPNAVSNLDLLRPQDSKRLDSNTSWVDALTAMNPSGGLVSNFGFHGEKGGVSTSTCSLDSLDCLLSTTNSNTDTSAEDETVFTQSCSDQHDMMKPITAKRSISDHNQLKMGETSVPYFDLLQSDSSTTEGGFRLISENVQPKAKKPRIFDERPSSTNINFQQASNNSSVSSMEEPDSEAIAQMKEMIYRAAAFRPVNLGLEVLERPKRKNVRISTDPQTVAARQRRERISERIRVLQRLVPGGSKMDTASMLDEAANYLKFLRSQVKALENLGHNKLDHDLVMNCPNPNMPFSSLTFNHSFPMQNPFFIPKP